MKTLFLMCGVSGSGKSTWVQKQIEACGEPCLWVSRDAIRYALVKEDEEYFSRETEVFEAFAKKINMGLQTDIDTVKYIFADATHLNEASRNKLLDKLDLENIKICAVSFNIPVETCLEQNEKRKGTRGYVPRRVIRDMARKYQAPHNNEKYHYSQIFTIGLPEKELNDRFV